jgi:hypothetical protein
MVKEFNDVVFETGTVGKVTTTTTSLMWISQYICAWPDAITHMLASTCSCEIFSRVASVAAAAQHENSSSTCLNNKLLNLGDHLSSFPSNLISTFLLFFGALGRFGDALGRSFAFLAAKQSMHF